MNKYEHWKAQRQDHDRDGGEAMRLEMREISSEIYLIQKGVRNCCIQTISSTGDPECDKIKLEKISDFIVWCTEDYEILYGLKIHMSVQKMITEEGLEYYEIFLYRYEHQREIYDSVGRLHSNGEYVVAKYILGKLLGYSDEDMERYFQRIMKENQSHFE